MQVILGLPKTKTRGPITKVVPVRTMEQRAVSDNSLTATYPQGDLEVYKYEEGITSTGRSKAFRQRSNFCVHHKILTTYSGDPQNLDRTTHTGGAPPQYYQGGLSHVISKSHHTSAIATAKSQLVGNYGQTYLSSNGQAHINQAFADLRPDLTIGSIPNFLAELDEIPGLVRLWRKNLGLVKNVAGGFLNYKFGWKPLMGEIETTIKALIATRREIANFEKACNVLFHRSKGMLNETQSISGADTYSAETQTKWKATLKQSCVAHIVYRPLPVYAVGELDRRIRGYLDALGFELNPSIIWDALPFTFVVDWFFNVGGFLEGFKFDTLELPISLVDSYLQYKEELVIESNTVTCFGRSDFTPWPRSGDWVTKDVFFHRLPLFPDPLSLQTLKWKQPTTNQAILGVALGLVLAPNVKVKGRRII